MKAKIFSLMALVLCMVSCQTEPEGLDVIVGGEVDTVVTVTIPEAETRANSAEGAFVNVDFDQYTIRYIFAVYYGETCNRQVKYSDNQSVAFDVRLVPDRDYQFVVWADVVDQGGKVDGVYANEDGLHYNTSDLKAITLKNDTWVAMDETRDAFTGTLLVNDFNGSQGITVKLTRPFAKLRVMTTDMEELAKLALTPKKVEVNYNTDHYSSFNAFAGQPFDKTVTKSHTIADVATYGEYGTLFVDYFFATVEQEAVQFDITVYDQNGDADVNRIKYNNFNTDIPVKRNFLTTIKGNVLTDGNNIKVEVENGGEFAGEDFVVNTAAAAQAALDNAVAGTTIVLMPNVNYGTLYLRPIAGGAHTKEVDWVGNNYRYETYSLFENITIIGSEGATVDAIKIEGGTYYNTAHSQDNLYPVMLSLIELKNFVIEGVTFTGKGGYDPQGYGNAINLSGNNIKVDGLTLKNCVLNNSDNNARLLYKTESTTHVHTYTYAGETYTFSPSLKDITITGCTLNGGYMGLELRETENVTITNNEFNVGDRNILLVVNSGYTYSGNITITGNVSNNAQERFVRADGTGDAVVVIKDNIINNYTGADADYIKVTNGNNVTTENNYVVNSPDDYDEFLGDISDDTWYDATKTELAIEDVADFAAFVETVNSGNNFEGKTIKLNGDVDLYFKDVTALADGDPITFRPIGDTQYGQEPFKGTFDGQGHTIKNLYQNGWDLGYEWGEYGSYGLFGTLENATVKNVVIEGSESYIEGGDVSFIAGSATGDCVFENITINSGVAATYNNGCGGIIGWSGAGNYTFKNITISEDVVLGGLWGSFDSSIGGIVGQAEPGATYNFENVTINCRIDAYNDCTASYDYYNYRMCGMIIGRCEETTTIDGKNYPDLSKYNMTFNNVVVNYGDWMNYHYCRRSGERAVRIEPGYAYGGAENRDHSGDNAHCMEWIPFNQLIGGDQYAVKGLPTVEGVTVNYPESFYREQGYKVVGDTYIVYTGAGFKYVATEVLADASKSVTIELANDIDLDSTINVANGQTVTIDLNGHNITSKIAGKPSGFELFNVNGKLEIKGNGTISLTSEDFEWNTSYRYTAINIRETGVVTLGNGVSVICEASKDGSYGMSYAVDIYTTGTLNINGASLHSNYIAVRCFFGNSVVNVNSGSKITSSKNNYGIWLQSSPGAVVTIANDVNYTFDNNIYYFN